MRFKFIAIALAIILVPSALIGSLMSIPQIGAHSKCSVRAQNVAGLPDKQVGGHMVRSHGLVQLGHHWHKSSTGRLSRVPTIHHVTTWHRVGGHWTYHHACPATGNGAGTIAANFIAVALLVSVCVGVFLLIRKVRTRHARERSTARFDFTNNGR